MNVPKTSKLLGWNAYDIAAPQVTSIRFITCINVMVFKDLGCSSTFQQLGDKGQLKLMSVDGERPVNNTCDGM